MWKPRTELQMLVQAIRQAGQDDAKDLSAGIAYWSFFSIFPLLLGITSLAGHFLVSAELQSRITGVVAAMLPGSERLVRNNLDAVVKLRGTMSWIGLAGLLWSASKVFGAVTRSVNRTLGAKPAGPRILTKLRYLFMTVTVSILMIASIGISTVMEIRLSPPLLSRLGLGRIEIPRLPGWAMSFLLVFMIFALVYKMAPYIKVAWRRVIPGALLAAVLFECSKAAFLIYLDRVAHFETVYGSLSSIIVLLLWFYISAQILVFGAEYNIARAQTSAVPSVGGTKAPE